MRKSATAMACKGLYAGSIPVAASKTFVLVTAGAQGFGSLRSPGPHPASIPRVGELLVDVR